MRPEPLLLPHGRAFADAAQHMRRGGAATLMSVAVMAIAIALPAMMYGFVQNQRALFADWGGEPSLTVFLRREAALDEARALAQAWRRDARVGEVDIVDRDAAFAEFAESSGLAGVAAGTANPLPHVLVVTPHDDAWAYDRGAALVASLEGEEAVDSVLVDLAWVERLQAIGVLAERTVLLLALLLGAGTLLIIGNTVRTLVAQQHEEIELLKLVGATDGFVRRPFLYAGALHGLLAGLLAAAMVHGAFLALAAPFARVAEAYLCGFGIVGLGPGETAALVGLGCALGWCGSWVGVGLSLRRIDAVVG